MTPSTYACDEGGVYPDHVLCVALDILIPTLRGRGRGPTAQLLTTPISTTTRDQGMKHMRIGRKVEKGMVTREVIEVDEGIEMFSTIIYPNPPGPGARDKQGDQLHRGRTG